MSNGAGLTFVVTRVYRLNNMTNENQSLLAFVDISVNDAILINGLKVVQGRDGLFVSMPQQTSRDGKWYNTVLPLTRELKDEIENVVLAAYQDSFMGYNTSPDNQFHVYAGGNQ